MSKKSRIYTKEFKKESVRLIVEVGRRISELSRELGISASLLRNWVRPVSYTHLRAHET